jgi:hypothetical protein
LIVEVELPRRELSGLSSNAPFLLAKLPYKLDPGWTDGTDLLQSLSSERGFPHVHAISGPFPPPAMSAIDLGGGSGGGTGSRACGIDIGMEEVEGEEVELYKLDELEVRNRSEGLGSWTCICGKATGLAPRCGISMTNFDIWERHELKERSLRNGVGPPATTC